MNKAKIHNDSLINNYLPADYLDSFSKEVVVNKNITPDTFFDMVFNRFPAWIDWLLKLRNKIVKPLVGLYNQNHNCVAHFLSEYFG